jgi:hypothetical protein
MLCRALIVTLLALPAHATPAAPPLPPVAERADLAVRLQALGVPAGEAAKRVDAMTDEEVASLAQGLAEAPAGEGLMCFSCAAKLLLIAVPIAALGYLIFSLLTGNKPDSGSAPDSGSKPGQAEPPKDAAPQTGK